MSKLTFVLTFILFIRCTSSWAHNSDTIIIRNFNTGNYKATSFNYSGLQAKDGNYYFANENGVLQYDGSAWRLHPIKNYSGVLSLAASEDDKLYIGGVDEFGFAEKDSDGALKYTSLRHKLHTDSTINEVWQTLIFEKDVYFVSYERILRWDGVDLHHINIKNGYLFPVNGNLYVSPFNGSFQKLQGDTTSFISDKIKFEKDGAFEILPGPTGKHIIFTSFHGLYTFDEQNSTIEKWDTEAGKFLEKNGLYSALLWKDSLYACTTSEKGLVFLNKKGEVVKNLSKRDGFSSNFLRDLFQDNRDNLWIASNFGIAYVQWPDLNQPPAPPATEVTLVKQGDSTILAPKILKASAHHPLIIHYATQGFDKADLEYSFYLEGFNDDWSAWDRDVKKEYTSLASGDYEFHVKARLVNGMESKPASMKIIVPKPWYLSNWFVLLAAISLVALIYLIIKVRVLHLKRINKQLEQVVNKRTSELLAQSEQLKDANDNLLNINKELDNFVYRSSHDLIAPLKSLKGLIHLAKIDDPCYNQMNYLKIMDSSVMRLEVFIKSIMEYSINTKRKLEFQKVKFDNIIEEILSEIRYYDKADKIHFERKYNEDLYVFTDCSRLRIILSNLITNSIKYHNYQQENPYIKIVARQEHNKTTIKVEDNGQGIPDEFQCKIFDMFFRASEGAEGSGLGLYIVKDTADKIGAAIEVKSKLAVGTTFTVNL